MSAFILDYDHNSPNIEHLQKTHENFFLNIRNKNQELPIIIISRPKLTLNNDEIKRKDIIKATFKNAVQNGDSNAYFIDGNKIFDIFGKDNCTVDNCHPNDLGFMCFAQALIPQLKKIFKM